MRNLRQRRTGFSAAALIAVLASACVTTAPKSPAESAADAALAGRIYVALNADPVYFFRHVDVRVDGGVASLSGYVWTADAIYRARHIAATVPGVTRVETNHLELERNGLDNSAVTR